MPHARQLCASAALISAFAFGAAACDDHDHDDGDGHSHDVDLEACEHMDEGPFADVTAASAAAGAPSVDAVHTAHRVTLTDEAGDGNFRGFVSYEVREAGDYVLFLDQPIALAIMSSGGADAPWASECTSNCGKCDIVRARYEATLSPGQYVIEIGPHQSADVMLLVEREVEDDDDHDH